MSELKDILESDEKKAQYDANAKDILAIKMVLANILVLVTKEFKGMDPKEVADLIEGEPSVGTVPMESGFTNEEGAEGLARIRGDNNESKVRYESVVYYDVFFHVLTKNGPARVYVNIEMQKDEPTEYDVEMRGIYYATREVSAQKGRDFFGKRYNDICPVYSIWLIMNTREDTIKRIHLTGDDIVGSPRWNERYDFINVVIARFNKDLQTDEALRLHRLLGGIFLPNLQKDIRESILEEFGVNLKEDEERKVAEMCNLAEGIYEQGIEKGIEKGIEQGIEKGIEQGIEKGMEKGMERGRLNMIMESVEEGDFSLERGAQKLGLTIQELTEQMKTAGRKIPA